MAITLYAVNKGYCDDVDVARLLEFESSLIQYVRSNNEALINEVLSSRELSDDNEKALIAAIEAFKQTWA